MIPICSRYLSALRLSVLGLSLVGCRAQGITCQPTSGTVTVGGQPAVGAVVILHPRDPDPALQKLRPYGTVDSAGRFTLNCMSPGDGAPAGEYDASIVWEVTDPQSSGPVSEDPEAAASVPDRLGGKYADPKTSQLPVTINPGINELPFSL